tara:strand:+ start:722 stop:2290 length:1569 start_codon:yes stop_codon:yes gene_type:complete
MEKSHDTATDLLLISAPLREMNYPPMALALLKSILHKEGYRVAVSDAQLAYHRHCGGDPDTFLYRSAKIQNIQARTREEVEASDFTQWCRPYIKDLLERHRPRAVGISVFTYISNLAAYIIARVVRELAPADTKIFIGGYGAATPLRFAKELGAPERDTVAETLVAEGSIDSYILGDGEEALVEYMKNLDNANPEKINRISGFDNVPYPDYSDLELDGYAYTNGLTLPVTGSKGCVRRCTFCDIPGLFGKYQQRQGKDIANECIYLYETYGAKTLYLTDSLVNGSMKSFMAFITELAELRAKKNYKDLQWTGQYITRPAHQIPHNRDYYALMAASGAVGLSVGAESGSNRVLEHMDKKMEVEDLFTELDYFRKYGLSMAVNILPSYPTETREDFMETMRMIGRFQTYVADGTLEKIAGVAKWYVNDELNQWAKIGPAEGMYRNPQDVYMWWYKHNPGLTIDERVFRRLAISKAIAKFNIPSAQDENYEIRKIMMWHEAVRDQHDKWLSGIDEYRQWRDNVKS